MVRPRHHCNCPERYVETGRKTGIVVIDVGDAATLTPAG